MSPLGQFFSDLEIPLTFISTIIVAWFGVRIEYQRRETKKEQLLQRQLEQEREDREKEKDQRELQRLNDMDQKICQLGTVVTGMRDEYKDVQEQVSTLIEMSNINLQYSQSVSEVVSSIGEGLMDSDIVRSETIRTALNNHRENEKNLVGKMCKILY